MANTFREVYKKTGTSSYQLVGNVGVGGIKLDIMKGASSSTAGEIGLVPKPSAGQQDYILTGSGNWKNINEYIKNYLKWKSFKEEVDASIEVNISDLFEYNEIFVLIHVLAENYYRRFSKIFTVGYDIVSNSMGQQYFPMGGYYSNTNYYFCGILFNPSNMSIKCDALRYSGNNYTNDAKMWIFYR